MISAASTAASSPQGTAMLDDLSSRPDSHFRLWPASGNRFNASDLHPRHSNPAVHRFSPLNGASAEALNKLPCEQDK
jgi:hypothetical protein